MTTCSHPASGHFCRSSQGRPLWEPDLFSLVGIPLSCLERDKVEILNTHTCTLRNSCFRTATDYHHTTVAVATPKGLPLHIGKNSPLWDPEFRTYEWYAMIAAPNMPPPHCSLLLPHRNSCRHTVRVKLESKMEK